eukprot:6193175-Pyramimonas_sp.AAC.1
MCCVRGGSVEEEEAPPERKAGEYMFDGSNPEGDAFPAFVSLGSKKAPHSILTLTPPPSSDLLHAEGSGRRVGKKGREERTKKGREERTKKGRG